jgi:AmmeMemoRadiSam system protein B
MADDAFLPKLRPVNARLDEYEGRPVVFFSAAEGMSGEVGLHPAIFQLCFDCFDGRHSRDDVREEYRKRSGGDELPDRELAGLIDHLDAELLLDSPRFRRYRAERLEAWRKLPARPAITPGGTFPSEPEAVTAFFDALYENVEPGPPAGPLAAVAVPHLDLNHGGRASARTLAGLAPAFDGETVVVLGVGHRHLAQPYALTPKDFETPLGTVPVDRDLYHGIVAKAGSWLLDDEFAHCGEHSIEYAAMLLRHALRDREFRILPVLCGSFHHLLGTGEPPREDPLIGAFLECLEEEAPGALLYASVDLAHVGPNYGDTEPVDAETLRAIEERDRSALDRMAARDGAGFIEHFAEDGDARRVCGMSALYTLLELLPAGPVGELVTYEQPEFPGPGNTVTICGMRWRR